MYQFRIRLLQGQHSIWRRILVSEDTSFRRLHEYISLIMDWDPSHSFDFFFKDIYYYIEGRNIEVNPNFGLFSDMEELSSSLEPISHYEEHFSDCIYTHYSNENWKMDVLLETKREGNAPPSVIEYCGDNPPKQMEYSEYLEMAEALEDPFSPEALAIREYFNMIGIDSFDMEIVNQKLKNI